MPCTRPLVREPLKGGDARIVSLKTYLSRYGPQYNWEMDPKGIKLKEKIFKQKIAAGEIQLIECGECPGCKLKNSANWANRLEMELPYHKNAWFLTLTYDDENVPYRYTWDNLTGEVITDNLSLKFDDLDLFWKNVRRHIEYHKKTIGELKYFQAGEYGGETHRPHYHAIVYDLPIEKDDLKEYKRRNGKVYYNCAWLEKIWKKGYIVIAPAEWNAMAYTARYTTKKIYGREGKKYYQELGIIPEKCTMSKGIGAQYYRDHAEEIYKNDSIQLKNGRTCKPPRYFDKLFDRDHAPLNDKECEEFEEITEKAESEELRAIKNERRRLANESLLTQLNKSSLSVQEYYTLKDKTMQDRMKKLIRKEV